MREAAKRSQISLSKAYAIANGDDNVEFETFENIASAFSMSPAELAVAIGKGPLTEDPKRVPIHAILREVPEEDLGQVDRVIRTFIRQAISDRRGRHVTKPAEEFGRDNGDGIYHTPAKRKWPKKESRSLAFQRSTFSGYIPALT